MKITAHSNTGGEKAAIACIAVASLLCAILMASARAGEHGYLAWVKALTRDLGIVRWIAARHKNRAIPLRCGKGVKEF